MATGFAGTNLPASVAALPFLFARPQVDDSDWAFRTALAAAFAAERADQDSRRNTRARIAYLLCELGFQLKRRGIDPGAEMPLGRLEIADTLGISLCRVKRTLALLSLSQVIASDGRAMRILDWQRLCGVAGYDPSRLSLSDEEQIEDTAAADDEQRMHHFTASGDPACFV